MSENPSISLIIVNQDRKEELACLISALRFQRLKPSEIIVVTNLPDEDRPQSPLDITYVTSPEQGISADRNAGIAIARGQIIAFCDDDAVPEFGWLGHLTAPLTLRSVAASGGYVRGRNGVSFQSQTTVVDRYGRDWPQKDTASGTRIFPPQTDSVPKTVGTNCAFRREALQEIGGFDEAYKFFMDETDVNIRLSDAGWQTAVTPGAEVHHGYAASRRRSSRRVPSDLYEIGASKAHFCQLYAKVPSIDPLMPEFIGEQKDRLCGLFHYGSVDAHDARRMIEGLQSGIEDGRKRQRSLAKLALLAGPELGESLQDENKKMLVTARVWKRKAAFAKAKEAALEGFEVTVFLIEFSARPLKVWFDRDGYWVHRIGILGRDQRPGKWQPGKPNVRIDRELRRVETQRQLLAGEASRVNLS